MANYDIYPAVDDNFNFPPLVRQALSSAPEILEATKTVVTSQINDPTSDVRLALNEHFLSTAIVIDGGSP